MMGGKATGVLNFGVKILSYRGSFSFSLVLAMGRVHRGKHDGLLVMPKRPGDIVLDVNGHAQPHGWCVN